MVLFTVDVYGCPVDTWYDRKVSKMLLLFNASQLVGMSGN